MKIVVLGPVYPYRGGIASYNNLLIDALAKQHDVRVVSFSRLYPGRLYPGKSDKDLNQVKPDWPIFYLLDSISPVSWIRTASWIRKERPDLLIIEWWVTFHSPAYWTIANQCRQAGIRVLYVIHNVLPHESSWVHRPFARLALGSGDFFLTHTPVQKETLLDLVPKAKAAFCPIPVFPGPGGRITADDRILARQQLNLSAGEKVLLFFGIVRAYKGLMVLIEAVASLHKQDLAVHLLIAGEFWESKEAYQSAIEQQGLSGFVHIEDRYLPDEEVRTFFAAADIMVAPYTGGTQSAVVSLARGYGIPMVLTDRSAAGLDPSLLDARAIARAGDVNHLVQAIRYRLENPTPMEEQGPTGWTQTVQTIESLLAL